eukprot:193017_1
MLQQIACQEPLPSSDGKPIDSFGQQNDAFQSHQETPPNHRKLGNMAGPVRVGQVGLHSMLSHHHRIRGHQQPWVGARGSHPNSELNNNAGAVSDHRVNDQNNDEISLFVLSAENEKGESDNVDTPKSDLPPSKEKDTLCSWWRHRLRFHRETPKCFEIHLPVRGADSRCLEGR